MEFSQKSSNNLFFYSQVLSHNSTETVFVKNTYNSKIAKLKD